MKPTFACLLPLVCLAGCGSQAPVCTFGPATLAVSPHTATADHASFAPYNQQQFLATSSPAAEGSGCSTPGAVTVLKPSWTVSDPFDVTISSAPDSTNGLATCLGPTDGSIMVTAHIGSASGTTLISALLHCT